MKIGEIVEALIRVRDWNDLTEEQETAVCAACNILDRLPNMMEEEEAKERLRKCAGSAQICPRCGQAYTEPPALSRADNKTLICPDCGMREALESWAAQENIVQVLEKHA